jgi:hypothetical protein
MATGITLEDLQATMQKAGIPMNTMSAEPTYKKQSQFMTASRGQIPGAFGMPNADKYKQDYMGKIAKIAEMDQKLAGVYGDPNSKLFIEHAGQRENAVYGARPVMEAQTQEPINAYNAELDQRDQKIEAAKSFYDQLIEAQQAAEKQKEDAIGGNLASEIDRLLGNDTSKTDLSSFIEDDNTFDLNNYIEDDASANLRLTL